MKYMRWLLMALLLIAALATRGTPIQAQSDAPPWLQIWTTWDRVGGTTTFEYRNAAGQTLASYVLYQEGFGWPHTGGRLVFGYEMNGSFPIFDPLIGQVTLEPLSKPADTSQDYYMASRTIPAPDGSRYSYAITRQDASFEKPAYSWIYVAAPGGGSALVWEQASTEPWLIYEPIAWTDDGSRLLIREQPVGIGGYILFWQEQNVRALDLNTGALTPLGNLDGYSGDAQLAATMLSNDNGPIGLRVADLITGNPADFQLPLLPEQPTVGGGAFFSPDKTKVAYQVARGDPMSEKFWTIVVDLQTGQSRIVLEDESPASDEYTEVRYGHIAGWLDSSRLVVGGESDPHVSAVIDVNTGTKLGELPGQFLGYAVGTTDTTGFAAPQAASPTQCPGAPAQRLQVNLSGRVTFTDGRPVNVRSGPGGDKIGTQAEGATFIVQSGPVCQGGYTWWGVRFDNNGMTGFVAEGDLSSYFLEPWP